MAGSDGKRRKLRLGLYLGSVLVVAVGIAAGVAYNPHASWRTMILHIAIACVGVGIILMFISLVLMFVAIRAQRKGGH